MARMLKCYGTCDSTYPKEHLISFKGKNYCQHCLETRRRDSIERENLSKMIQELFNLSYPTGLILRQMKTFREERNYSYQEQADTLNYINLHTPKKLQVKYGIALIPYYIEEMKQFVIDSKERAESNNYNSLSDSNVKTIKMTKIKSNHKDYQKNKLLNMEDILE